MPSVINLAENKRSTPAHDEWATIGVHLATRVAQGQTREQAVAAVAALGVHPGRIQRYIKRAICKTIFSPKLGVMLKILSSEYQLYACGKIFLMP